MDKEGAGDLQTYISYLKTKQNKLSALGDPLKESEMVGIFLNGLTSLFNPVVVVLRGVAEAMPKTLDEAIEKVRKFAGQPAVASELLKSKGGSTQHLFSAVTFSAPSAQKRQICKLFSMGKCRFGEKCKFAHIGVPSKTFFSAPKRVVKNIVCSYCKKAGHSERRCVGKFLADTPKETPPRGSNAHSACSHLK